MVKAMRKQMRFVARSHFVRGLSSMLDFSGSCPRKFKAPSPMQALRGDVAKIGADMYRVIERERQHEKAARKENVPAD